MTISYNQNFELLGGPVGDAEYCNKHTTERVHKATKLLQAIGELPDPQVALLLLRQCASFGKMVYSIRVVPSEDHREALQAFDAAVRACFESFTDLRPDDRQWEQATLSTKASGLGLRSLDRHSCAGYLSSRSSCHHLCAQLDAHHRFDLSVASSSEHASRQAYNALVAEEDQVPPELTKHLPQRQLSNALDAATTTTLLDQSTSTPAQRAHLRLVSAPGAGQWLHATPTAALGTKVDPVLYSVMLQRRLRIPFADSDDFCPMCDGIMDRFGDHALTCCCGGDRTERHNLIRNTLHQLSRSAGFASELEKPDLLRPRPLVGSTYEDGSARHSLVHDTNDQRRPADVYIPRWKHGTPAALDLAVTSGLRDGMVLSSANDPALGLQQYEDWKCSYMDTRRQCTEEGMTFIPIIIEAVGGGLGQQGMHVIAELAKTSASASGESASIAACSALQRLSMVLHRENARAILRRR